MNFELSLLNSNLLLKQAVSEVLSCNDITEKYNLLLTNTQAAALVETRVTALKDNGRIEFGAGVIEKIILAFCDSPYISMHNYEETIHELLEIFYYYKNESNDFRLRRRRRGAGLVFHHTVRCHGRPLHQVQ